MPLQWKEMEDGGFPKDAFISGSNEKNNELYVARVTFGDSLQPCQLLDGNYGAQMAYGGEERIMKDYEVLTSSNGLLWKSITVGQLPPDALKTGKEGNGNALYTVKCKISGKTFIGKYNGNDKAYVADDDKEKEIISGEMRILCFRDSLLKKNVSGPLAYIKILGT